MLLSGLYYLNKYKPYANLVYIYFFYFFDKCSNKNDSSLRNLICSIVF